MAYLTVTPRADRGAVKICLAVSVLAHLVFAAPLDFLRSFELGAPVQPGQPVMVDLQEPWVAAAPKPLPPPPAVSSPAVEPPPEDEPQATAAEAAPGAKLAASRVEPLPVEQSPTPPPVVPPTETAAGRDQGQNELPAMKPKAVQLQAEVPPPPIHSAGEFLSVDREQLSYRISMLGIPVGTAELEANNEKGEVRITLQIRSNAASSQLYPVDDRVETRHIGGNFILSRIVQHEGSFRSDRGFTLFLRDKSVFWIDRIKNLSLREPLPSSEVVDVLSALYYLRNKPLEVGTSLELQLFDSNRYAPTTVSVLRREHLKLPGLREVDTVLIHPQLKTDGVFRRTGEVLIWLTDDPNRVPVKVETRIALGKVTAELVSARTHRAAASGTGGATAGTAPE